MSIIDAFKEYDGKQLSNFPEIVYSNLYKKVLNNFYFEFAIKDENLLLSPLYTMLRGPKKSGLIDFVQANEAFLDSMKKFILNSLYAYSALIEENAYYLSNPQSILIARMIHKNDLRFEIKFYAHYEDEVNATYKDKIYIGRDFVNLEKFERKYLGLKKYFLSLIEQNQKIQERAKQKLRYFDDYKKEYLDEIDYLTKEAATDSMERMKLFPQTALKNIQKINLQETLDHILYMQNLMLELRDFTQEFENKLRLREENNFVKYLTKFLKDLVDGIRYLRKLSCLIHYRISNYEICKPDA